ncbi:MAG TPA: 4-(cytidine 5'-diphospho)-2-C-methyl-D-erythritol kinase [Candidatus Limnocylindria bacterium]|nr:4-(cytidine 5'-diphospho)-2-C-methyl-D-erythritol kinase [Candidatus Limnocylindria bacterium]
MRAARLAAPAKVNLCLAVIGRRPDGYHELVTDMVLLELADELLLLPGCAGLRVSGATAAGVPVSPSQNLAWRGLLAAVGGAPAAACLELDKRIPAAAGLGGGSSDAAAGWRLGRLLAGRDDPPTGSEVAALVAVGADVPFFAATVAAARVTGVGEDVAPIAVPATAEVVLAEAPDGLSTAAVFAELRAGEWSTEPDPEQNDLLAAARRLRPEIDELFRMVTAAGGAPRLSGSGPTVFSLTDDPERADAVVRRLLRAGVRASRTRLRREPASIELLDQQDGQHEEV